MNYLKGCVQGHGNYEELTSYGVDPRELFDDMEDVERLSDYVTIDNVIEEGSNAVEEANEQTVNLLPKQMTSNHVRLRHFENDPGPQMLDGGSIHTTPSMLSLISMPNQFEDDTGINEVTTYLSLYNNYYFSVYCSVRLMWYQKREHMELFLAKHTLSISKKE